jgi:hypothetical protein
MQAKRSWVAMAVALGVLAIPTPAISATTIGSHLAPHPSASIITVNCAAGCTFSQRALPGTPAPPVTAPTDGVIVRWRIRVGPLSSAQVVKLRVIRGESASSTGVGSSQAENVPAAAGIYTFTTRLPISSGDFIGIDCCVSQGGFFRGYPDAEVDQWAMPLGDNETRGPDSAGTPWELMVNADVEPDCDADGFGDETQDPDTSSCQPQPPAKADRTLTLDANKTKVMKGRKVLFSGQLDAPGNEAACESSLAVELQRKKPTQTAFTTLEQLGTDAAGNFTAKEQVKKTYEYRAQVPESPACNGQLSNTEKVKVKKKK